MGLKRFLISSVAVFVLIFVFDAVFHGNLLMGYYEDTAQLWRSPDDMKSFFQWGVISQLLLAFICTWIFSQHYENKGLKEGVRFGLYIGLFMGILQFGIYPYMPIPMALALCWGFGSIVQGIGIGLTLSYTFSRNV